MTTAEGGAAPGAEGGRDSGAEGGSDRGDDVSAVPGQQSTAASSLLEIRDLAVRTTSGKTLIHDVNFSLGRGQTLGIVGESGSGKTTAARSVVQLLASNVQPTGSITFEGVELIGQKERRMRRLRGSRIGIVLQDPFTALNPLQTVRDHLRESLDRSVRRDRKVARAEIEHRLREVGLDPDAVLRKYPFQLSGGMRQRVALAAALAGDPELLIADEPTTALDVTTQAEVLELLKRLQRDRAMALVLITHDLRVAFSICDRIMVMYAGSVVEDSPAQALSDAPEHPYSLGLLLAEPPITHYVERLSPIPGTVPSADDVAEQCAFAQRCRWAAPECFAGRPALRPVGDGRRSSACRRVDEIRQELRLTARHLTEPASPPAPSTREALLVVGDLEKSFRTRAMTGRGSVTMALKGVSFGIAAGESLGLVGETGSGKTTIARCILGLVTADSGSITLSDIDISKHRKLTRTDRHRVRRLVQVVFQDPYSSLNPSLTIGAALAEALRAGGVRDNGSVADLLVRVGLPTSYAERRPAGLSGGERQRVAIARAIAARPELLICDEPVAGLDVSIQAQILELLRDIRSTLGTSMLFITHDLSVVRQMTDRALVLFQGEIVEQGLTPELLDAPQHPYTIRLINSVPSDDETTRVAPAISHAQALSSHPGQPFAAVGRGEGAET
ncbi:MAG: dipeptide ABC transporter ATP-binding protein [Acidimicrobiales bacterium]